MRRSVLIKKFSQLAHVAQLQTSPWLDTKWISARNSDWDNNRNVWVYRNYTKHPDKQKFSDWKPARLLNDPIEFTEYCVWPCFSICAGSAGLEYKFIYIFTWRFKPRDVLGLILFRFYFIFFLLGRPNCLDSPSNLGKTNGLLPVRVPSHVAFWHLGLARWRRWSAYDVGEATERL